MIVVWGRPEELSPLLVALRRRGADVVLVDQDDEAIDVVLGESLLDGCIRTRSREHSLGDVDAVYLRPLEPRPRPAWRRLLTWADASTALVVNRPAAQESNASKPFQGRLIRAAGFGVPDTLITTDAEALRRFRKKHGEVIFKSISGQRSIVTRLTATHDDLVKNLRWCPTMFQAYVPGREVRANVVGDTVFAAQIRSTSDDYRYGPRAGLPTRIEATTLPDAIERRVVEMCSAMGLPAAGVDLRETPSGEWVCFEVNPSPGFLYYEAATGQPITDALATLLVGA